MERTRLAPGVYFSRENERQFNCCRLSLHFVLPASRQEATARAVLPLLLERGYADCPDMTRLSRRLADLYGAALNADTRPMGSSYELCVSITGICNRFALQGEDLAAEYRRLLLGTAFHPCLVNGVFDPEAVEIEKAVLKQSLENEINDKQLHCALLAERQFFGDSPAGIQQGGYLDEVDGVTPWEITEAWRRILSESRIELMAFGFTAEEEQALCGDLLGELAAIARQPAELNPFSAQPRTAPRHFVKTMDTTQAKLCLLFTSGRRMDPRFMAAYRMAVALLGGTPTSRLFTRVREQQSLCYYCSANLSSFTGCLSVNCGIEPDQAARAEKAILTELAALCGGPIEDEEFEHCRRRLMARMKGVEDSLGGLEAWYFTELNRGDAVSTPRQAREQLELVTKEDVRAVLNGFSLSVSYLLTPLEEAEHE